MKIFLTLLKSNFLEFTRDRVALFFSFAFPVIFMLIFGLVFSGSTEFKYNIGIVNQDGSATSQKFADSFRQIPVFSAIDGDLNTQLGQLKSGDLKAIIVFPAGIDTSIAQHHTIDIALYFDPSQSTSAQIILPIVREFVNAVNQQATGQPALIVLKEESIQSHELGSIDYLVPGMVAMSILFLGLFAALPLIQQREKKILKRLGATPMKRSSIIYGQVVFRLFVAMLQTAIIISLAYFVFHVAMLGNWVVLVGLVALGTLTLLSIGYLIASLVRTEESANPIIQLVQFPMLFLSGVFFPIEFLPAFIKPVVMALPLTYLADGLRQTMVLATPAYPLVVDVLVLAGWLAVCLALSIRFFKWE